MYDGIWQCMEIKYNLLSKISSFQRDSVPLRTLSKSIFKLNLPLLPHNVIPVSLGPKLEVLKT